MHGYARNERDEAILAEYGIPPARIWLEGRGAETIGRINMRPGETLATVGGLRPLGNSRQDIVAQVERIRSAGAVVLDVLTKLRSDQAGVAMYEAALRRLRGERVMPDGKAKAMQAKSVAIRTAGRLPERQALIVWKDPKLTTGEAIALMPGWSARSAYNHLGSRGLPVGPRGRVE